MEELSKVPVVIISFKYNLIEKIFVVFQRLKAFRNRLMDLNNLTPEVILNMLLSYREVQDYDEMVSLVEDVKRIPDTKIAEELHIQNMYAFALNRRNKTGDRDKALAVIQEVEISFSFIYKILI